MKYLIFIFSILVVFNLSAQVKIPSQVDGINIKGKGTIQAPFYLDTLSGNFGLWQKNSTNITNKNQPLGGVGVNRSATVGALDVQARTGSNEIAWFFRESGNRQFRFQSSSNSSLLDMYNSSDVSTLRLNAGGGSWISNPLFIGGVAFATESLEVNGNIAVSNAFKVGLTGATPIGSLLNNSGRMAFEGSATRSVVIRSGTFGDISTYNGATGAIGFSAYGSGTVTGTAAKYLAVESDGDVIEVDLSAGMDAVVANRSYVDNTAALVDLSSGQVYYNTTSNAFVVLP
jgi:hypothetical protein